MRTVALSLAAAALVACAPGGPAHSISLPADSPGLVLAGNPEANGGASWTFRGTVGGVRYDLAGVLLKPPGPGPFPAVLLSHGYRGSATLFASLVAPTLVRWGLVCIAVNYTHAAGVPGGAPGGPGQPGASRANLLRAHMTVELLKRLPYVDSTRIALHGHSMGAYVNTALAGAYPAEFRVASQTGGGVRPDFIVAGPAPTTTQARGIRVPFQMHHGDADTTVPLSYDVRLDSLLSALGVDHQLVVYPGGTHLQVRTDPAMFDRMHAWYGAHGMF